MEVSAGAEVAGWADEELEGVSEGTTEGTTVVVTATVLDGMGVGVVSITETVLVAVGEAP